MEHRKEGHKLSDTHTLYLDPNGMAYVVNNETEERLTCHPYVSTYFALKRKKQREVWKDAERVVKFKGRYYNIDVCRVTDEYEEQCRVQCTCGGNHVLPKGLQWTKVREQQMNFSGAIVETFEAKTKHLRLTLIRGDLAHPRDWVLRTQPDIFKGTYLIGKSNEGDIAWASMKAQWIVYARVKMLYTEMRESFGDVYSKRLMEE